MTPVQHAIRISALMVGAAALLAWDLRHTEATFADGLRYIRQAEQIESGAWRDGLVGSIDHPLHPLGIVAAHAVVGGDGPVSWQRAAVALGLGCTVLLVLPLYLLGKDLFGERSAWLGCVLVVAHPLQSAIVVNVLSESSFLLCWTWGLWAGARFLREGEFRWLPPAIACGVLAYLSRPEGLLLPAAMVAVLALLPLHRSTRLNWPRWWRAVAILGLGSLALAGPYMLMKGGIGTKPAIARVLGLAPKSDAHALERDRPLPPNQTALQTYGLAAERVVKVVRGFVSLPLLLLAVLGLATIPNGPARARVWLFLAVLITASLLGLMRLHATGGYCTTRHALVPCTLMMLAAAGGLTHLVQRLWIPGRWFGLGAERLRPGVLVWAVPVVVLTVLPRLDAKSQTTPGPFSVYRDTAAWLGRHTRPDEQVLDLTDWSLYFSERPGYRFAHVYDAPKDASIRWLIARKPHVEGRWNYSQVVRQLVGQREPALLIPPRIEPGQVQLRIYDLRSQPTAAISSAAPADAPRR